MAEEVLARERLITQDLRVGRDAEDGKDECEIPRTSAHSWNDNPAGGEFSLRGGAVIKTVEAL